MHLYSAFITSLKGALQWSIYPQRTGSIFRRKLQPLLSSPCMLVLILPTSEGWKAEWTSAGKKVAKYSTLRQNREMEPGTLGLEGRDLTTAPTPPLPEHEKHRLSRALLMKRGCVAASSHRKSAKIKPRSGVCECLTWLGPAIHQQPVTGQRSTSKKQLTSIRSNLSPPYSHVILVSGYLVLTGVHWP